MRRAGLQVGSKENQGLKKKRIKQTAEVDGPVSAPSVFSSSFCLAANVPGHVSIVVPLGAYSYPALLYEVTCQMGEPVVEIAHKCFRSNLARLEICDGLIDNLLTKALCHGFTKHLRPRQFHWSFVLYASHNVRIRPL